MMEILRSTLDSGGIPVHHNNVEEWSNSFDGILEHNRVETDRWANNTSNSSHQYGKVVDSRARNLADGSREQRKQMKQLEVFQARVPGGGSVQVIRSHTSTTSSKSFGHSWTNSNMIDTSTPSFDTSNNAFDDLKLAIMPLNLNTEKTKINLGRSGSMTKRRPPSHPRSLICSNNDDDDENIDDFYNQPIKPVVNHQQQPIIKMTENKIDNKSKPIIDNINIINRKLENKSKPIIDNIINRSKIIKLPEPSSNNITFNKFKTPSVKSLKSEIEKSSELNKSSNHDSKSSTYKSPSLIRKESLKSPKIFKSLIQSSGGQTGVSHHQPLESKKSISIEDISSDYDNDYTNDFRRSSTARRSLNLNKDYNWSSQHVNELENVFKKVLKNKTFYNSPDLEETLQLDNDRYQESNLNDRETYDYDNRRSSSSDADKTNSKKSFVSVETIQNIKNRLKPIDDVVVDKFEDSNDIENKTIAKNYNTGSLETRQNKNEEWYNRRKSYGFEQMKEPSDTETTQTKLKSAGSVRNIESSTDSGIAKSNENIDVSFIKKKDTPPYKNNNDFEIRRNSFNKNSKIYNTLLSLRDRHSKKQDGVGDEVIDWTPDTNGVNISKKEITPNEPMFIKIQPNKEEFKSIITIPNNKNEMKIENIGNVIVDLDTSEDNASGDQFKKIKDFYDYDNKKQLKKVEFSKTEVHFEPGKVNIIETNEKPPPNQNYRRKKKDRKDRSHHNSERNTERDQDKPERSERVERHERTNHLPDFKFGDEIKRTSSPNYHIKTNEHIQNNEEDKLETNIEIVVETSEEETRRLKSILKSGSNSKTDMVEDKVESVLNEGATSFNKSNEFEVMTDGKHVNENVINENIDDSKTDFQKILNSFKTNERNSLNSSPPIFENGLKVRITSGTNKFDQRRASWCVPDENNTNKFSTKINFGADNNITILPQKTRYSYCEPSPRTIQSIISPIEQNVYPSSSNTQDFTQSVNKSIENDNSYVNVRNVNESVISNKHDRSKLDIHEVKLVRPNKLEIKPDIHEVKPVKHEYKTNKYEDVYNNYNNPISKRRDNVYDKYSIENENNVPITKRNDVASSSHDVMKRNDVVSSSHDVIKRNDLLSSSHDVIKRNDLLSSRNDVVSSSHDVIKRNDVVSSSHDVMKRYSYKEPEKSNKVSSGFTRYSYCEQEQQHPKEQQQPSWYHHQKEELNNKFSTKTDKKSFLLNEPPKAESTPIKLSSVVSLNPEVKKPKTFQPICLIYKPEPTVPLVQVKTENKYEQEPVKSKYEQEPVKSNNEDRFKISQKKNEQFKKDEINKEKIYRTNKVEIVKQPHKPDSIKNELRKINEYMKLTNGKGSTDRVYKMTDKTKYDGVNSSSRTKPDRNSTIHLRHEPTKRVEKKIKDEPIYEKIHRSYEKTPVPPVRTKHKENLSYKNSGRDGWLNIPKDKNSKEHPPNQYQNQSINNRSRSSSIDSNNTLTNRSRTSSLSSNIRSRTSSMESNGSQLHTAILLKSRNSPMDSRNSRNNDTTKSRQRSRNSSVESRYSHIDSRPSRNSSLESIQRSRTSSLDSNQSINNIVNSIHSTPVRSRSSSIESNQSNSSLKKYQDRLELNKRYTISSKARDSSHGISRDRRGINTTRDTTKQPFVENKRSTKLLLESANTGLSPYELSKKTKNYKFNNVPTTEKISSRSRNSSTESTILEELTKAADEILLAVNGYTDDDSIIGSDDELLKNRKKSYKPLTTINELTKIATQENKIQNKTIHSTKSIDDKTKMKLKDKNIKTTSRETTIKKRTTPDDKHNKDKRGLKNPIIVESENIYSNIDNGNHAIQRRLSNSSIENNIEKINNLNKKCENNIYANLKTTQNVTTSRLSNNTMAPRDKSGKVTVHKVVTGDKNVTKKKINRMQRTSSREILDSSSEELTEDELKALRKNRMKMTSTISSDKLKKSAERSSSKTRASNLTNIDSKSSKDTTSNKTTNDRKSKSSSSSHHLMNGELRKTPKHPDSTIISSSKSCKTRTSSSTSKKK